MQQALKYCAAVLMLMVVMFTACENDIERINLITDETDTPVLKGTNIEVIYSDSARVKVQVLSPTYLQYVDVERPYMEFPNGLEVFFYNDSMKIESEIRADYSIYYTEERLWHATGNVVARRFDSGDALYTEELFWDEEKEEPIKKNDDAMDAIQYGVTYLHRTGNRTKLF